MHTLLLGLVTFLLTLILVHKVVRIFLVLFCLFLMLYCQGVLLGSFFTSSSYGT